MRGDNHLSRHFAWQQVQSSGVYHDRRHAQGAFIPGVVIGAGFFLQCVMLQQRGYGFALNVGVGGFVVTRGNAGTNHP